jgi:hypothetical protein
MAAPRLGRKCSALSSSQRRMARIAEDHQVGRRQKPGLIIPAKKLIDATGLAARDGDGKCLSW